jgi:hypothetical protein
MAEEEKKKNRRRRRRRRQAELSERKGPSPTPVETTLTPFVTARVLLASVASDSARANPLF